MYTITIFSNRFYENENYIFDIHKFRIDDTIVNFNKYLFSIYNLVFLEFRTYTDYGGGTDTYYGFICPDCGCFTELNSNDLPSYVKSSAKSYKLYENAKYND